MSKNHPKGLHMNRFSAYLTFVPAIRQPDEVKKMRIDAYYAGLSCSHWADKCEPKKIPFHLRGKYEKRGFRDLPMTNNSDVHAQRYEYI